MKPYKWQLRFIRMARQGHSLLLACKPGAGKTYAIVRWLEITPREKVAAIVVAPSLVIYDAWTDELENRQELLYGHGHSATFEAACEAFACGEIQVLLTTPEMLRKIETTKREVLRRCRQLVVDESTKYKSAKSSRFASIRRIIKRYWKIEHTIAMTGTLLPKDYLQLFSQLWIVGQTGVFNTDSFNTYRETYFYVKPYKEFEFIMFPGFQEKLEARIAPYVLQPDEHEYADMPPLIEVPHYVNIGRKAEALHKEMGKEGIITIGSKDIIAANAGVTLFKQLQICSGGVYKYTDPGDPSSGREWIPIHSKKQANLLSIVEEANGNVLILYCYLSTRDIIRQLYPDAKELKSAKNLQQWKSGELEVAFGHPASMGHGLNLQSGGNVIIWFDITPDAENWWQAIKRLHRGAITEPVYVHYLLASFKGSKDLYWYQELHNKYGRQEALLKRLKLLEHQ